jgi:hypothetical protein
MDAATALGAAMIVRPGRVKCARRASLAILFGLAAAAAGAEDRYAVVITGASGGEAYAKKYQTLRASFTATLRDTFSYADDHLFVFGEEEGAGTRKATRENVQRAFADLRTRLTKDDQLLVFLAGHGTVDAPGSGAEEAKFNLVGPDLTASEWADLLRPLAGRLVFVDTTGGSFPFLKKIASRNRVVLIATDSAAQEFETVFPEFFVKAFEDETADADRNGRVSMWEAFQYASGAVRQWFEQKGQLATERPLLDDTGAGVGREAQAPGNDGAVARTTYLEPLPPLELPADAGLAVLVKRRAAIERSLEELKARKESMPPDQYEAELERVLTELARISSQIRAKS